MADAFGSLCNVAIVEWSLKWEGTSLFSRHFYTVIFTGHQLDLSLTPDISLMLIPELLQFSQGSVVLI